MNTGEHAERVPRRFKAIALVTGVIAIALFFSTSPLAAQSSGGGPGGGAGGGRGGGPGAASGGEQELDADFPEATLSERVLSTTVAGRLRPKVSVPHASTANGLVTAIHVQVGERVDAGTPLYTIERDEMAGSYAPAVVRSRVAGLVSDISVHLWNEVRAGDTGVVVIDPETLLLETYITDKDADRVIPGMVVEAVTADGHAIPGRVLARSPEPDYGTGLFRLRFEFTPDSGENRAGRFVTVDLPVVRLEGVFVPQDLLVRRYGRYYLWVVTGENTLRLQELTLGTTVDDEVLVTSGLAPGTRYLPNPTGREREGMPAPGTEGP